MSAACRPQSSKPFTYRGWTKKTGPFKVCKLLYMMAQKDVLHGVSEETWCRTFCDNL